MVGVAELQLVLSVPPLVLVLLLLMMMVAVWILVRLPSGML